METRAQILKGRPVADRIYQQIRDDLLALPDKGRSIRTTVILASNQPAAQLYVTRQCYQFNQMGIGCEMQHMPEDGTEEALLEKIDQCNRDDRLTGIVMALPLPAGFDMARIQASIDPAKDVEGVHPYHLGQALKGKSHTGPATAQAVLALLDHCEPDYPGLEAVVVGHSDIVGKPVALGLMNRLCTVTVCHVATRDLAFHTRRADILVTAVGKAGLITPDMVPPSATVVDVGINEVTDAQGKTAIVGDVDFDGLSQKVAAVTPVPGGVGPITMAILMRNAVNLAKERHQGPEGKAT